ncbi:hypothetical protein QBC43DRAFT_366631 [Cladorrhinum sp. PSN259]|nr:hypothetical protein QBC43DRAFT_366631 [Cladorrhinum sp. PSN259]
MAPSLVRRSPDLGTPAAKEDISGTIIACSAIMMALSTLVVGLRFYVRGCMIRNIASEDWCILAAWACTMVATGGAFKEAQLALGHHIEDIPPENMMAFFKTTYFKGLFYNMSISLTKISILLLYLRVLKTYDYLRKAMWATLGFVILYSVVTLTMYFTICVPLERFWDRSIEGYCHPDPVWWTLTYTHIVTDFIIFLLPIPVVVTMSIPFAQKAGLLFVFCVGFFVCLISVLRAIWLNALYLQRDVTWDMTQIANWSSVEINVAVVCACLTTLKPLFQKVFRPWLDKLFPRRNELQNVRESRPPTIGSSPLRAFRARVLHPLGRATFLQVDSLTTVNELETIGSDTLAKSSSAHHEDISQATTSNSTGTGKEASAPNATHIKK